MNEIIIIGKMTSIIKSSYKNNVLTAYLKVKNEFNKKNIYIPVCFKCMNDGFLSSLTNKKIAISGHLEFNKSFEIFVDVLQIV